VLLTGGAILVAVMAVALGAWLTLRAMRRAADQVDPRCALCGQPGASLTSFRCPGCGHDVRERGLIVRRGRSPMAILCIACAVALVVAFLTGLAMSLIGSRNSVPPIYSFSLQVGFAPTAWLPQKFSTIDVTATGRRSEAGFHQGRAWLDLKLPDGAISTLEVDLASYAARLTPVGGKPADAGMFDRPLLEKWMDRAGVPDGAARRRYLDEFAPLVKGVMDEGTLPQHHMEVMKTALMVGGGGGASVEPPRGQWQFIAIGAPLVWLALTWGVLSTRKTGATSR